MPTDEELANTRQTYDKLAATYEREVAVRGHYEGRVRAFLEGARAGTRLLDVACGPGQLTRDLPATVAVSGVDLSPAMVALARAARPAGTYLEHDFHEPLPPELREQDMILATSSFEFCIDLDLVLGHLAAGLRPGGRIFFTVVERRPGLDAWHEASAHIMNKDPPITVHLWSFAESARAVERARLVPVRYEHAPGWQRGPQDGLATVHYGYWEALRPR